MHAHVARCVVYMLLNSVRSQYFQIPSRACIDASNMHQLVVNTIPLVVSNNETTTMTNEITFLLD